MTKKSKTQKLQDDFMKLQTKNQQRQEQRRIQKDREATEQRNQQIKELQSNQDNLLSNFEKAAQAFLNTTIENTPAYERTKLMNSYKAAQQALFANLNQLKQLIGKDGEALLNETLQSVQSLSHDVNRHSIKLRSSEEAMISKIKSAAQNANRELEHASVSDLLQAIMPQSLRTPPAGALQPVMQEALPFGQSAILETLPLGQSSGVSQIATLRTELMRDAPQDPTTQNALNTFFNALQQQAGYFLSGAPTHLSMMANTTAGEKVVHINLEDLFRNPTQVVTDAGVALFQLGVKNEELQLNLSAPGQEQGLNALPSHASSAPSRDLMIIGHRSTDTVQANDTQQAPRHMDDLSKLLHAIAMLMRTREIVLSHQNNSSLEAQHVQDGIASKPELFAIMERPPENLPQAKDTDALNHDNFSNMRQNLESMLKLHLSRPFSDFLAAGNKKHPKQSDEIKAIYDALRQAKENLFQTLTSAQSPADITEAMNTFKKTSKEYAPKVDKIMGHGWLYRTVEVAMKAIVGLFAGIGMVLGGLFGQGILNKTHQNAYNNTFFKWDQTEPVKQFGMYLEAIEQKTDDAQKMIDEETHSNNSPQG